ncbi:hypothetical protein ACWEO1_06325 [Kitasatospora cineracea]
MATLLATYRTAAEADVTVTRSGWFEPTYTAACDGCGTTVCERQSAGVLPADAAASAITRWAAAHCATCRRTT